MIYNVGNPIIKLPFGDGFCITHKKSDVGMVYEWVYQIIYSVMVIIHESIILILLSYLYISGIIMLDDHNPWKKNLSSQFLKGRQRALNNAQVYD